MSNPRDPARMRQGLNPLLTQSLGSYHSQISTPLSGVSSTQLNSAHTPASSIQPYNPQEWIASPAAGAEQPRQYPEQRSPLPPPPYSPPRSQRPQSGVFDSSPAANISAARIPPTSLHRPSPEPATNTSFPPPPGTRTSSRERRFGLHSLRRSREHHESSPPEPVPPVPSLARPNPLQIQIPQPVPQRNDSGSSAGPPGARRAASASAVETPTSARSRSTSQTRWEPGMPLPPPPPGPPPASSRSQSLQSMHRTSTPMASPPTRRPPPSGVTALGPVPPTPANWADQPDTPARPPQNRGSPGLTIDTSSAASSVQTGESSNSAALSSGSLSRARAVRHDKTIVQRRAESRNRYSLHHNSIDGTINPVQLSEIVVPNDTTLTRRLTINKSTPRSGGRTADDTPRTDEQSTTPRAGGSAQRPRLEAATPPFSPHPVKSTSMVGGSPSVVPKALPTPPPQTRSASSSQTRFRSMTPAADGPSSASISSTKHSAITQTADQFCHETIERFQAFAVKESTAASDADRVRLFADFITSESRIRRERYSAAIGAMGSEIFDLTRDLFRPMVTRRESGASQAEWTPQSSEPTRSHRGSLNSIYRETPGESSSAPASAASNVPISPVGGPPNNANWNSNYMPSLSPILSMSVSDKLDEADSRGRPSSRWWEADSTGTGGKLVERSKRESKYMGVPKEAREALQWMDSPQTQANPSDGRSSSEYPPEKMGWHEPDSTSTPQQLRYSAQSLASSGSPTTPNPAHLDVSRLVTLPPPYPRHHPAVNNSHPELTETRTAVRQLSDLSEVGVTKERFQVTSNKKREEASKAAAERRQALRVNLQQEVNVGNMTFAEASAIEQDSAAAEKDKLKELGRTEFEQFQAQVVMPLNELVTGRIAKATTLFDKLASGLFDNVSSTADMPQEEGDDKPELLEKLTLLKWIFEAREMLHRAIYDVLTERNDRYREVVLTPYRLAGNQEKLQNAVAFFAEDAAKRELAFAHEVLARTQEFQAVVEQNVMRGVEVQLSAFWDIAPPLRRLLEKIPPNLDDFNIQIPTSEYEENPSYRAHPLQYLFSLLLHTEKSTYQFIESQTNLLCLLHEVKEAVTHAKAKAVQSEGENADGREYSAEEREARAQHLRQEEGQMLTDDLKEKVRVVQDQWNSALGENIKNVKQMLGEHLLQTGGWDETLEEGGVGSV
ncbi:hypothetical protein CGCF415_v007402 [Colletotrichum fructicola]|uniref:Uncharacterized protein n=2 Tax=Colletotrichum fructicola (strain Nara gc5) TaxID=1213859 RepID=A0A7J6IIZ6_COLFN|nr:hypothetical protein CFRS1_v010291 [Colletotrichum fructicola]KAF4476330.1 hypothetical protein CGGC5_v014770 [Colletotrichum fructicola Nara gc5]KAF4895740.1 hypothetical protein CGCFRS4_v005879 [Colletotrichum fructicola]KAF4907379.1 hypothetical protein CGCF415_v007402 [Colletotrichum fructicola]KAF4935623.1 hypothetical protein CGCF245_v007415 [Colletotrichum fructicola]